MEATLNPKATKPAYILTIDFGSEIGTRTSSAQITQYYKPDELVGKKILAVVNFASKMVAGVKSEVLILATVDQEQGTLLIHPSESAKIGTRVK